MKKFNKKGFTIVELVVVIAVIAILAAVLIPTFSNVVGKAKESKAMQEAKAAYDVWRAEHLTDGTDTTNICISNGTYKFHVVNGQFETENVASENHDSCTKYNVSNGALTPVN